MIEQNRTKQEVPASRVKLYKNQDDNYGKKRFDVSTLTDYDVIFYEFQAYSYILHRLLNITTINNALEVGCGPGFLSPAMALICKDVLSFDLSPNAIAYAKEKNSNFANIKHFIANGMFPERSPEINSKFDFILIREFHPFTRKNFYETQEISQISHQEIVEKYLSFLSHKGVLLIIHKIGKRQYPFKPKISDGYELVFKNLPIRLLKRIIPFFRPHPNILINIFNILGYFSKNNGFGYQSIIVQKK